MATARGAVITLCLEVLSSSKMVLKIPGSDLGEVQLQLDSGALREARGQLNDDLEEFKGLVGEDLDVQDFEALSDAIQKLHRRGRILSAKLFGQDQTRITELFRKACHLEMREPLLTTLDQNGDWQDLKGMAALPRIEVVTEIRDYLPVEFLPLFNRKSPPEKLRKNTTDLLEALSSFPGFSVVIKRSYGRTYKDKANQIRRRHAVNLTLENDPKLPVKFFQFADFVGAGEEISFFRKWEDHFDLEGPWPDQCYPQNGFGDRVFDHIWHYEQRFNGEAREKPCLINHFSCHCYTTDIESEKHFLRLAYDANEYDVTLGDLLARFGEYDFECEGERSSPLVFFNACGGSKIDPQAFTSFPEFFFNIASRGFIGAESRIPDSVAAKFSTYFYTHLLSGYPLGDAIQAAKRLLARRHNNPLGLLYTVYADPDLEVQKRTVLTSSRRPGQRR